MRAASKQHVPIDCVVMDFSAAAFITEMLGEAGNETTSFIGPHSNPEATTLPAGMTKCVSADSTPAEILGELSAVLSGDDSGQASEQPHDEQSALLPCAKSKEIEKDDRLDVVVCKDNEVNQIVFTQILESGDYSFMIANNGREGVELIKQNNSKVVTTDVSMPETNGLEATGVIRALDGPI